VAVIWIHSPQEHRWLPVALIGNTVALSGDPEQPIASTEVGAPALVMPLPGGAERILLSPNGANVRVNGDPVLLGVRVLRDRDAICIGSADPVFFSTESVPRVAPFDGDRAMPCARCHTPIVNGAPAVCCPRCRKWHHAGDEVPCWNYAEKCAGCDQPTALDGGYQWSPEGL
jgi:hypothetical protein